MVRVTFRTYDGTEVRQVEGQVGATLMQTAVGNKVAGVEAACGGSEVCGTCHVYVDEPWYDMLSEKNEIEREMLEYGVQVEPNSRLSCQIVLSDALDGMTVRTPSSQR